MPGRKKKSSSKKQVVQKPAKFTIPDKSPVRTRSVTGSVANVIVPPVVETSAERPAVSVVNSDVPKVVIPSSRQSSTSRNSSIEEMIDLKLEDRFSRMETSLRSSITSAITSAPAGQPRPPTVTDNPKSVDAPPPASKEPEPSTSGSSRSRHESRHRRHRRRRSPSSSSSSSDSSRSSSRSSSSSSDSDSSADSRRRSRDKRDKKEKKKRKYTFDTSKYLKEGDKLLSYERLVLANACMALKLYKKKKDIKGFLQHVVLIAEKAETRVFARESLIRYDESVKEAAKEKGIKVFGRVDPATIMRHLCYDGTQVAVSSKRSGNSGFANYRPAVPSGNHSPNYACLKYNFAREGCRNGRNCRYKHICSACSSSGHVNNDCPNVDKSAQAPRPSQK